MIGLLIAGFIMVVLEMFLPGMILGVCGIFCLLSAILVSFVQLGMVGGLWTLTGTMASGVLLVLFWMKYFPRIGPGRKLLLESESDGCATAAPDGMEGMEGEAITPLRPSGTARIGGKRCDVVAEGSLIDAGQKIRVLKKDGMRIIVRATE